MRNFLRIFLALSLTSMVSCQSKNNKMIFCYWRPWSTLSNSNPSLCTHVSFAFESVDFDGKLGNITDMAYFSTLKTIYPNVKFMVSVDGSGAASAFKNISNSAELREAFAGNVLKYLQDYNLDGVDIDWEFPDKQADNFSLLLEALYNLLHPLGYLVSIAAGANNNEAGHRYDVLKIAQFTDFINLMTYNYHGSWETVTGIGAPLYSSTSTIFTVHMTVQDFISKIGTNRNKLNLGIPLFGPSWNLTTEDTKVGAPGEPSTAFTYNQICENIQYGWTRVWDDVQKAPYAYGDGIWVGYDDADSIREKINYVKRNGMGGVFFWEMTMDDFSGACGEGEYPLMKMAKHELIDSKMTSTESASTITTTAPTTSTSTAARTTTSTTEAQSTTPSKGCEISGTKIFILLQLFMTVKILN